MRRGTKKGTSTKQILGDSEPCSGAQSWELHNEDNFHVRWIDFLPPMETKYANYSEYVAVMFENEAYGKGATHTAEALRRVREEDIKLTRDGQKFVMVFTDGMSNDPKGFPDLAEEANRLNNSVDEVYAYGIGEEGVDVNELLEIASDEENVYVMYNFTSYIYVINKFILEQGGCDTDRKKPFRKCFIVRFHEILINYESKL